MADNMGRRSLVHSSLCFDHRGKSQGLRQEVRVQGFNAE